MLHLALKNRSPEIEPTGTRASLGGWGLGAGNVENSKVSEEEEEEDEPLDWDQAQVCASSLKFMHSIIETFSRRSWNVWWE